MKDIFNKIQEAYNEKDENKFVANVRNWMAAEENNPFEPDTVGHALFFSAKSAYSKWKGGAINSRNSKVRMANYIRQMMEQGVPNPYVKEVKEKKKIIFGVVPDKTVEQLKLDTKEAEKKIEELKEQVEEIKAETPVAESKEKHFFGKKKKR